METNWRFVCSSPGFAPWHRESGTSSRICKNGWQSGFIDFMEMLSQQVVNNQDLLDLTRLPHVEGENLGPLWNRKESHDEPDYNILPGRPIPRYPVWDNYLSLAKPMLEALTQDGRTPKRPSHS